MPYRVVYTPSAREHLRALTARQRGNVLDAITRQLVHEPTVQARNRKPLRPNPVASWELRVGDLRIYYDVIEGDTLVDVRAVGVKVRDRVYIGGQETDV